MSRASSASAAPSSRPRFPPQVKYIIGNEAAERFSYYGMAAILTQFMSAYMGFSDADAEWTFHIFVTAVYFTPLFGAFLSDRFIGRYQTIVWLSLFYVAGHAVLALLEGRSGMYAGLALIALGAGGIKPCVSAFAGDQFTTKNKELLPKVFSAFYWSINLGSFFATLLIPYVRGHYGPRVAFAIPGILMAIAIVVFLLGRKHYLRVPPTGKRPDSAGRVLWLMLRNGRQVAEERVGARAVDDALAVLRVAKILAPISVFWALYFQTASSWVLLCKRMNLHGVVEPDQLQAANPALIMVFIPLFTALVYPALSRRGINVNPLRRITAGLALTGISFFGVAAIRWVLDGGDQISVFWILLPYTVLTAGEVLVSLTGLEFAYTQAPTSVKSTIMSIWMLTFAAGNFLKAVVASLNIFDGPAKFVFWAALMLAVAVFYGFFSRTYRIVEYVNEDSDLVASP